MKKSNRERKNVERAKGGCDRSFIFCREIVAVGFERGNTEKSILVVRGNSSTKNRLFHSFLKSSIRSTSFSIRFRA